MIPNKLIPMGLVDPPDIAMRSEMDEDELQRLTADIAKNGLLSPICVKQVAGRYRIAAGHRRFVCHQRLGRAEIEAKDYTNSGLSDKQIMFAENRHREDVNPADEALWFMEIQQDGNLTLEQMQELTGESEDYISKRLSLMRGDKTVWDALKAKKINLGHAIELNAFPDDWRPQYLGYVIESTPPIKTVQQWRREIKLMNMQKPAEGEAAPVQQEGQAIPGVVVDACGLCDGNHAPWDMTYIKVHKGCLSQIKKAIADQMNGGS